MVKASKASVVSHPEVAIDGHHGGSVSINFDPYAGAVINKKVVLPVFSDDGDSVQAHLDTGTRITVGADGTITYGFYTGNHAVGLNNNPHYGEGPGYSPFTEEQKEAAVNAIQLWDDLIPQTFVNVGDVSVKGWAHNDATILFANTTTGPLQAWTYYPGGTHNGARVSSDVWTMDPAVQADNGWFGYGQYGNTTLTHELGHALGLSHPGNYNGSAATTYAAQAEYFQDSTQYTIMSYWSSGETGARMYDFENSGGLFDLPAQTPLLHDISVIQAAYGADTTTRADSTIYGFNSNAGNGVYDFSQNALPHLAIYDAGGEDTIDLSGYTVSQVVDLNPGAFSSIGQTTLTLDQMATDLHDTFLNLYHEDLYAEGFTQDSLAGLINSWYVGSLQFSEASNAYWTGYDGLATVAYDNVAIDYHTIIENATGGQARDLLQGNAVANVLDGQGGDDVLIGAAGNDTLTGGSGSDLFVFANDGSTDTITDFATGVDRIDLTALSGVTASDVVYNATTHQVEIDLGTSHMFINSENVVNTGDYLFA